MIRRCYWLACLLFAGLLAGKFSLQTGFSSLIRFGETWQERRHVLLKELPLATFPGSNGYDGQFYAQLALDPLLLGDDLKNNIDAPAYRSRRILTPATATVLGLGNPWWTIQAYSFINILCWFTLAWLLSMHFSGENWIGFARWIGCMFSMGILESVRQSLVDLPALVLLTLAVISHNQSRSSCSTAWLALGNLAKETNLLGSLALEAEALFDRIRRRHALWLLASSAVPFALWSLYVASRFPESTGDGGLGNFTWPALGLLTQAKSSFAELFHGNIDGRYSFALIGMLGLIVQFWTIWSRPIYRSPWWRIGAAYSLLSLVMSSWIWSGYWAACRAALPMTIAFNLLLPRSLWFWPLWIAGNLTILHAVWRFL